MMAERKDFDLDKIMRDLVELADIPNYLMKKDVQKLEELAKEQDRLEKKLLNELGLAIKRR